MDKKKNYRVPNWTNPNEMTPAHGQMVLQYMKERCARNNTADAPTVVAYTHGASCVEWAYWGGVLNQDGTRIYLVPYGQATATVWHYINTADSTVVAYTHGATGFELYSYYGGVLAPNGRIYLVPNGQATKTTWHYIDTDGTVVAYTHGATCVTNGYAAGILQPNTGRIYLAPRGQSTATVWHYIDTDGTVVAYTHGATVSANGYRNAMLAPNGKIFLIPAVQATVTNWHYIDTDGSVIAYSHTNRGIFNYAGALGYDGNLYLSNSTFYINPNTLTSDTINGSPGSTIGAIMGIDGNIYYAPSAISSATTWTYLNVSTKTVVEYTHGATVVANGYGSSGVLAPNGRIYLVPYNQATATVWHYIQTNVTAGNDFSTNLLTSPYLNKF